MIPSQMQKARKNYSLSMWIEEMVVFCTGDQKYRPFVPNGLLSCEWRWPCINCDRGQAIARIAREETDPVVHYGLIASSNLVVRDGVSRDNFAEDCLCFETEAAGLMNSFPCVVIQGISDYSDSHKNDQWQLYAAAMAAAYAKKLLSVMVASDIAQTRRVAEFLGDS
jgi:hypothetical protein